MIYQGVFNILDYIFKESDLFYIEVDNYFKTKLSDSIEIDQVKRENINEDLMSLIEYLIPLLLEIGFEESELTNTFFDPSLKIKEKEKQTINSTLDLFDKRIAPLIHELIFEKICHYLVNLDGSEVILTLRKEGAFPLELLVEIRQLKDSFNQNEKKIEVFKDYIQLKSQIIDKYCQNKAQIENLEDLRETRNKIQLLYLIYRIIHFFHLERIFDFEHIEIYLQDHIDEWLRTIPLVSLRNPDLYFCGIYLAYNLGIKINKEKVKGFISELYLEYTDEYEAPIMEGTSSLYYFGKSHEYLNIELKEEQIKKLVQADSKFFESHRLKDFETARLVVILKIYKMLGLYNQIDRDKIQSIEGEIEKRIKENSIQQHRDGLFSSEATYYVLFYHYMVDKLDELRDIVLLDNIISRIYRNIELMVFSEDTSYDLVSEIFYSCESLKLLNCIEKKFVIIHLARYLFPEKVFQKIQNEEKFEFDTGNFRHLGVDPTTGETIY
ncbi:MAG: hypothetical protein GF311_24430 [Candidatus Lokiarchaeota archaeon]|nr:hypothetical protein [Candidatus Lokiarchaeota archaeon]